MFSLSKIMSNSSRLTVDKSRCLGKYWRVKPLRFSLLPRCQLRTANHGGVHALVPDQAASAVNGDAIRLTIMQPRIKPHSLGNQDEHFRNALHIARLEAGLFDRFLKLGLAVAGVVLIPALYAYI